MSELKKINVDDLNGLTEPNYKVITQTIQEANPVKFSELCEEALLGLNQEALIHYSCSVVPIQTSRGSALMFVANIQYWSSEKAHKEWIEALNRNNLIIRP